MGRKAREGQAKVVLCDVCRTEIEVVECECLDDDFNPEEDCPYCGGVGFYEWCPWCDRA